MSREAPPPPVQMIQMLAGFQVSQALYVAAKLGVADELAGGPRSVDDLATGVGVQPKALRRLLRTLASLGVFAQVTPDVYGLTPLGDTLRTDVPGSMSDLAIMWMETHYAPFGELLHTLQTGQPAAEKHYDEPFFDWLHRHPHHVERFTASMANLTSGIKHGAIASCDFGEATTIVDVGGADGSTLALLLEAHPQARGVVYDLPPVVAAVEPLARSRGLGDRLEGLGGDFFESVPPGDAYFMSLILHDWDDDECARILGNICAAAPAGARVVAMELVVSDGDDPHMSKMIDLTMLGILTGRERSRPEFESLFEQSGFRVDRIAGTPTPLSVVEATKA